MISRHTARVRRQVRRDPRKLSVRQPEKISIHLRFLSEAKNHNQLIPLIFLWVSALALQLPFCLEVRSLSDGLVSSAPERPGDDMCRLDSLSREPYGDAANFLD
jgi:hypothetical protein